MEEVKNRPQGGPPVSKQDLEEALDVLWKASDKSRAVACLVNDLRLALWGDRRKNDVTP